MTILSHYFKMSAKFTWCQYFLKTNMVSNSKLLRDLKMTGSLFQPLMDSSKLLNTPSKN